MAACSKAWDAIRFEVDHRGELGQFSSPGCRSADTKEITHSGTRRFTWLTMRPMSLYESGDSTGEVSIKDLFEGNTEVDGSSDLSIDRLAFLVCRAVGRRLWICAMKLLWIRRLITMMQLYTRILTVPTMYRRIQKESAGSCALRKKSRRPGANTVLYWIFRQTTKWRSAKKNGCFLRKCAQKNLCCRGYAAWNPNSRSKTAIRSSDTRYYVDPSIVAAVSGIYRTI